MKSLLTKLGLVAAIAILIAMPATADSPQTGTVEGTVNDAGGGPLPGVTVTLASDRGAQTAVTGEDGAFRFGLLAPGDYTVGASLEGFRGAEQAVHVDSGGRSAITLTLGLESSEAITVTSEAPLVNKFEVATVATVDAEVAEDLSFNSRNYQSVTYMMPGVVQSSNSQSLGDHRPGINGGTWQENAAFVDGVDTSNTRRGGSSRMFLPTTALAEVRMDGSGYGAEYGRVTGGVTGVITKSGTNQFHGDFLYIAQSQDWRAQSDEVPIERDDDITDSYEAALGGPIFRDKAWFFVAAADNTTNEIDVDARRHGDRRQPVLGVDPGQDQLPAQPAPFTRGHLRRRPRREATHQPELRRHLHHPALQAGRRLHHRELELLRRGRQVPRAARSDPVVDRGSRADRVPHARPDQEHPHPAQQPRQVAGPVHHLPVERVRAAARRRQRGLSARSGQRGLHLVRDQQRAQVRGRLAGRGLGDAQQPARPLHRPGVQPEPARRIRNARRHARIHPVRRSDRDQLGSTRGLRAGPHHTRRSLGVQRRSALRGPVAQKRHRPGAGAVLGPRAAPRGHLRRRAATASS